MALKEKTEDFNLKTPYYVSHDANHQGLDHEGAAQDGSSWLPCTGRSRAAFRYYGIAARGHATCNYSSNPAGNQLFEGYGGAYVVAWEGIVAVVDGNVDVDVVESRRREKFERIISGRVEVEAASVSEFLGHA
jgi:hypothetical protein